MAHLLRLNHYFRNVNHSLDYSIHFSASVKELLESSRPCNRCLHLFQRISGNAVRERIIVRHYSSGFAQLKLNSLPAGPKSQWKEKKRKKNSEINQKIHSDLLKVLNRRAVQLLFSREANQLHRSLVTNFSFVDFPLQDSMARLPDPLVQQEAPGIVFPYEVFPPKAKSSIVAHEISADDWDSQVLSFDKMLKNVIQTEKHTGPAVALPDKYSQSALSGGTESLDYVGVSVQSDRTHSEQLPRLPRTLSESSLNSIVERVIETTEYSPAKHAQSKQKIKSSSSQIIKPQSSNRTKTTERKSEKGWLEEMSTKNLPAAGEKKREFVSKLNKQLKVAKSEQKKFQSDPNRFNRVFNQELLAYVDACCFAGLESDAYSFLRLQQHKRISKKNIPPDMKQIQDINIYNKLMSALARKGQLEDIRNLFSLLREEGLKANLQSYAALWECLGHQKELDISVGLCILEDMKKEELDVKDLFNKSIFYKDEREVILKALRTVDPGYEPYPPPEPLPPTGPLVENLSTSWPLDQVVEKNPFAGVLSSEQLQTLTETQMQRELRDSVPVQSILKQSQSNQKIFHYKIKLDKVKEEWKGLLTKAFEKKVRSMKRKKQMEMGISLYPFLSLFEPKDYVQCLMQEVEELVATSDTYSPSRSALWKNLSGRIYSKFVITEKIKNRVPKKMITLYKQYLDRFMDSNLDLTTHRQLWQSLIANSPEGPSLDFPVKVWPDHISMALGKLLYELIIYELRVDTNLFKELATNRNLAPAFYTIYRSYITQTFEEIKPHPVLVKLFKGYGLTELSFNASFLPMLVPPVPWISTTHGGYLFNNAQIVRIPVQAQAQAEKMQDTVASSQLSTVLDSLNVLGGCAWIINKPILDIIIDVFNNKGNSTLDIPPPASECPQPPKITEEMTVSEKSAVYRHRQKFRSQKADMYSLWCQELYKLSIANTFRDEVFWFPHNLDFRGRTYPCPPHFNHLGDDVTRSILMFAKGKPLGPNGLDWLKIHLINLTGFKKRSPNRERLAYANEMMPEILDSADNPMTGNKWWQTSDEPWQTLACCMEVARAVRSGDPEHYVSHLPVHQDGSCNGLQHYAALGRDTSGAQSVNLWPYDKPQDVYSDVCEMVEKERQKDAAAGVKIAQYLEGFVRRKVIKQTIMTTVYGVTRYGARSQILRQLKDIPELAQDIPWHGSIYLTDKTMQCLNDMFSATKAIQDWLILSAQMISIVCQRPVEWTTPIGLLVVQPYHKTGSLRRFGIVTNDNWNYFEKPDVIKQKNAFPPNFIHSLDSTHMLLTALFCTRAGITFVSVHDCFWTHACNVEIMNKICREQFMALHKQPILENLSKEFISRYTPNSECMETSASEGHRCLHNVLANVPARGDFDLEKVSESTYFFS